MAKDPIKKAENGTYYFRANLGYDALTGKQIQRYKSGFKTKKEAKTAYSKLLLSKPDEIKEEKNTLTFKEYLDTIYKPWYKTQVKESTYDNRKYTIDTRLDYFSDMLIDKIGPLQVQAWQLELSKKYGQNYVRSIQGMFSRAMDRAVVLGLVKSNPAKVIGNVKKLKVKIDFWTLEEFEKVISQINTDDYYEHYLFMTIWLLFMTGLRFGEACALQWSDIDFETGVLNISKNLYYKSLEKYKFVEPKTKASIRQIVLDEDTLNELSIWKNIQQKVVKTGFILSYNGTPSNKHTIPRAIEKYSSMAGVHRIKVHALRHSHASLLISLGENPLIIKDRLGHEDIETTLGTYGHLYPNSNYEVATKLKGLIKKSSPIASETEPNKSNYPIKLNIETLENNAIKMQ
ncbi:site-specific integrase [Clostridioides difficile]|uniref:site-specific integrase n=1 Tax=Clostridioides difficile TaxID=1496 RepID=UPI00289351C0|nr:site-specific integrase [Clostridioides difficile]